MQKMRSSDAMVKQFKSDPELRQALVADPIPTLEKVSKKAKQETEPIYRQDKLVYRMVIVALGLTLLAAAGGAIALALSGKQTPEILIALGSAAVGALAGLFVPSPVGQGSQAPES